MDNAGNSIGRAIPQYIGDWQLSDEQVNHLVVHHSQLTMQMLRWLDHGFRFRPNGVENVNWLMLGQHVVELLNLSDRRAFQATCHGMVQAMANSGEVDHPFVAASMAEAGLTKIEQFQQILQKCLEQNSRGLFSFPTGFLNLGDEFSTLWALRLVALAGSAASHPEKIDNAVRGLELGYTDLEKHADHVGFYLYVLLVLGREQDRPIIERCVRRLTKEDTQWQKVDHNLRQGGFVAYDLMLASELHLETMPIAEQWLAEAFCLSEEPKGIPEPFAKSQKYEDKDVSVDGWAQGYLRALVAASLYLRQRRPDYTPVSTIIANDVGVYNQYLGLAKFYVESHPYLPSLKRMQRHKPLLQRFWADRKESAFDKSVFISRWMGRVDGGKTQLPIARAMADAISDELAKVGLYGRYAGDVGSPYTEKLWDNNEVYMRGCKYGIAVFDGMPGNDEATCGTNHNVLVEAGFMWGKGASVLVLRDPARSPGLPTDLNGILHGTFDHEERGLAQLRAEVKAWGEKIVKEVAKSEQEGQAADQKSGE